MVMVDRWVSSQDTASPIRIHQHWLDWPSIPEQAALAVITSEDQRFPIHQGFDFNAILTAIKQAGQGKNLRGASTISQQVAKNMYLWTGRSWFRKALEVWFTVLIEVSWGKQRILEVYLNIAEWGDGVFGLEAASRYHFGRSASQLTPMQSALLASTLPSPLNYQPSKPSSFLLERAYWNLEQQKRLGGTSWLSPLEGDD